jgi:hypothetical protein
MCNISTSTTSLLLVLGEVGLVRLSDIPLHASTAQLGATSWQSNLLFFSNPHSTVFLSIDEFSRQCLPYSPHSLLDTNTDYYL